MGRISKEEQKKRARNVRSDKWDKENSKNISFRLMNKSDAEVIKKLECVDNKTDYIRQLILADIEKERNKNNG